MHDDGAATILSGHDFGPDIGLPSNTPDYIELERSILRALQETFSFDEIKECLDQAGRL